MSVMIQLRNVPEELHRKLKVRAAQEGLSLTDYILRDVQRLADLPTPEEVRRKLASLRPLSLTESTEQTVRSLRDSR